MEHMYCFFVFFYQQSANHPGLAPLARTVSAPQSHSGLVFMQIITFHYKDNNWATGTSSSPKKKKKSYETGKCVRTDVCERVCVSAPLIPSVASQRPPLSTINIP